MKKIIAISLLICAIPMITIAQWSNTPYQNTMIVDTIGSQIVPIVDLNGQVIKQYNEGVKPSGTYSKQIDISDLSPGMYIIKLQANNLQVYCKIIKN